MHQMIAAVFSIFLFIASSLANPQSVSVKGIVSCDGQVAENIRIKLIERDTLDPNDLVSEVVTGFNGEFFVSGTETEVTPIEPEIHILHRCGNPNSECFLETVIEIPAEYIFADDEQEKVYDAGVINLRTLPNFNSDDCYYSKK